MAGFVPNSAIRRHEIDGGPHIRLNVAHTESNAKLRLGTCCSLLSPDASF